MLTAIRLEPSRIITFGPPSPRVPGRSAAYLRPVLALKNYLTVQLGDGSYQGAGAIDLLGTSGQWGIGIDQAAAIPYRDLAIYRFSTNRTVTDAVVTNGSTTLTSATAAFVAGDVGRYVRGTGIPAWTTITARTDGQTVTLSAPATRDGSSVYLEIGTTNAAVEDIIYVTGHGEHAATIALGGSATDQSYRVQVLGGSAVAGVDDTAMGTLRVVGGQNSVGNILHVRTYAGGSNPGLTVAASGATTIDALNIPVSFTIGATPAQSGGIRLTNNTGIYWRNGGGTPNTSDVGILLTAVDNLAITLRGAGNAVYPSTDAAFDLGGSANRWRLGYLSDALVVGTNPASAGAVRLPNNSLIRWRNAANSGDIGLSITSADHLSLTLTGAGNAFYPTTTAAYDLGGSSNTWRQLFLGGYIQVTKIADPGVSAANTGRLYVRDNGSGKMQFCAVFPSGAVQVIAQEP